jgi:hypothetical protein
MPIVCVVDGSFLGARSVRPIDLGKLNMWQPLHNLLVSPSSSDTIKTQTLWVIGTAVQNNPSAQSTVRRTLTI